MSLAGCDDVVVRMLLLQHQPHRLDVVARETPIALGLEVSQQQLVLQPHLDAPETARDFPGDEVLASPRRFMVEQDAVYREQLVCLSVVDCLPMSVNLRTCVGAPRMK